MSQILLGVVYSHLHIWQTFVTTHQTVYVKRVNFTKWIYVSIKLSKKQ